MKLITTKCLQATTHRGTRIKAVYDDLYNDNQKTSITRPYDYTLNADENHTAVARELSDALGFDFVGEWDTNEKNKRHHI